MSSPHAHQLSDFVTLYDGHHRYGIPWFVPAAPVSCIPFGGSLDSAQVAARVQTLPHPLSGARGCDVMIIVPIEALLLLQLHGSVCDFERGWRDGRGVEFPATKKPVLPQPWPSFAPISHPSQPAFAHGRTPLSFFSPPRHIHNLQSTALRIPEGM